MAIIIGTCGYDYPEWVGQDLFYPASMAKQRQDWLTYYSSRFSFIELNFTYYGRTSAAQLNQMLARVDPSRQLWLLEGQYQPRPDFGFILKAYAELTHRIDDDWRRHAHDFKHDAAPLRDSGKLLGILAQFPSSAHYTAPLVDYVHALAEELQPMQLIAEFRHATWYSREVREKLIAAGIVVAGVDAPRAAKIPSVLGDDDAQQPAADASEPWPGQAAPFSYIRMHGRNESAWWSGDAASRYEYRYGDSLLERLAQRLLHADSDRLYVSFNNHRFAAAPRNAIRLQEIFAVLLSKLHVDKTQD
jgi:uncharacterized protein YecE (DUF72 family)